ncbi:MAG: restriction endonuclease, partial [Burkholderiales bacterium]|nr:restriction endonuclease [Burkholderiales bacterium]
AAGSGTGSSPPSVWASSVLDSMRQERFERLIEMVFETSGFECRTEAHGPGQAADIWLRPIAEPAADAGIVRCRIQQNRRIGVAQLEELAALMRAHRLAQGHFATNGRFEPAALDFARSHGIVALDGKALLERIDARPPAQRQALLKLARTGAHRQPACPRCGALMRRHRARDGRRTFWACGDVRGCAAAQAATQP